MASAIKQKFLFIHIMKTGGTSFSDILRANFAHDARYPDVCLPADTHFMRRMEAYLYMPQVIADVNRQCDRLQVVGAHMPYALRSLLKGRYQALTLLRDPVERTVSHLKHCRKYHKEHRDMSLEQIYELAWFKASFFQNYQTKVFSMSQQEAVARTTFLDGSPTVPSPEILKENPMLSPEAELFRQQHPARFCLELFAPSTGVINVDTKRLATAKENLSAVELVGVTERYEEFLIALKDRYGWKLPSIPKRNVGSGDDISAEFRNRIKMDNAVDAELYEYAKSLSP